MSAASAIGGICTRARARQATAAALTALGPVYQGAQGATGAVLGGFGHVTLPPARKPPSKPLVKPYRALLLAQGKAQGVFRYPTAPPRLTPASGPPIAFYGGLGVPNAYQGPYAPPGTVVRPYMPGMAPLVDTWTKTKATEIIRQEIRVSKPIIEQWFPKLIRIQEIDDIARCEYCGLPADGKDHLPPQSVRWTLRDHGITKWPFMEVDCCGECNSLLGASPPWFLAQRKQRLKILLRRRYSKYLNIPDWSDYEVSEHDPRGLLGFHIRKGLSIKQITLRRLRW